MNVICDIHSGHSRDLDDERVVQSTSQSHAAVKKPNANPGGALSNATGASKTPAKSGELISVASLI
jgi:hypothetical protein